MADYTFRNVSITTDPQTVTFSSLGTSLESRAIGTLSTAPVVIPISKTAGGVDPVITATTTTGFTVNASDFGEGVPLTMDIIVRTFDTVATTSNAKTATVSRVRRLLDITAASEILTDAQIQERIDDATEIFSRHKPVVGRFETIGNAEYEYALPSDWIGGFSVVKRIEYPAGGSPPTYIDENEFYSETVDTTSRTISSATASDTDVTLATATDAGYFRDGELVTIGDDSNSETNWVSANGNTTTGVVAVKNALANNYSASPYVKKKDHVKFTTYTPLSSEVFTLEYTAPHTHTDSTDTILGNDYEPFTWLCASLCATSIVAQMSKRNASTISADVIDNVSLVQSWRDAAEDFMSRYKEHFGLDENAQQAVMGFIDTDEAFAHGREFLFHGRRII